MSMPSSAPHSAASPAPHSASAAAPSGAAGVATAAPPAAPPAASSGGAVDPRDIELDSDQLTDGAAGIVMALLPVIRQSVSDQVTMFLQDVDKAALVDLKGEPESDFGLSLFKVLGDIALAAFPEIEGASVVLMEVGKEAVSGFGDLWTDHVKKGMEDTASSDLNDAKGRLMTAGKKIAEAALGGANDFFSLLNNKGKLQKAAESILAKHPELAHYGGNDENQQALADAMGVTANVSQHFAGLAESLNSQLQDEVTKVTLELKPHDFDGDEARLDHLIDVHEKQGKDPYAEVDHMGWHHDFWDPFIRIYFMAGKDKAVGALAAHQFTGNMPDVDDYRP